MSQIIKEMLLRIATLTDEEFESLINQLIAAGYTEAEIDNIIDIAIINAIDD